MKTVTKLIAISLFCVFGAACQMDSRQQILAMDSSQVALRAAQSRIYDVADQKVTIRTVISTLQDLGFTVDRVDRDLGIVSGTKVEDYKLRMTVTTRARGDTQIVVRANAQFNIEAVSDAEPYQQFFNALEQAIFLEAQGVN